MLYKYRPPAVIIRPTAKSTPQLDFREVLSTPEEKLFSPPAAAPVRSVVPAGKKKNIFGRGVRLSRRPLGEPAVLVVSAVVLAALVVSADITKFASLNGGR